MLTKQELLTKTIPIIKEGSMPVTLASLDNNFLFNVTGLSV
mgnify:CR=1 FL=1